MINIRKFWLTAILAAVFVVSTITSFNVWATTATDLDTDSDQALQILYKSSEIAKDLSQRAKGILVFPKIIKAGLVFGGAYGEGELMRGGEVEDYYNSFTGSWGLQAGAQSYGYAVFLMTDEAVNHLQESQGWEIGTGPTVVLVDAGIAKNLTTSTLQDDAYAFIFDQQGLMAGISIEGTKISKIKR